MTRVSRLFGAAGAVSGGETGAARGLRAGGSAGDDGCTDIERGSWMVGGGSPSNGTTWDTADAPAAAGDGARAGLSWRHHVGRDAAVADASKGTPEPAGDSEASAFSWAGWPAGPVGDAVSDARWYRNGPKLTSATMIAHVVKTLATMPVAIKPGTGFG